MNDYAAFLERKTQLDGFDGFDPVWMPDFLFPFQVALTDWAIRDGLAAVKARPDVYCTGGCDACRDFAREQGVQLIVPKPPIRLVYPTRWRLYGGSMVPDTEGQWVHVRDLGLKEWRLHPPVKVDRDA